MSEVPSITGYEAIAAFEKAGYEVVRVKGSHHNMSRKGHRFVLTVPVHKNRNIRKGTLRSLIRDAGMTIDQFRELL